MNDELKEIIELINTKYEDYYIDDFLSGEDVKKLADYINNLQQKYNDNVTKYEELLEKYFNTQQRIDKAIEYLTSYDAISTIQGLDNIKKNKELDENTMNIMTNRYLEVHHKLLDILEGDSND